MSSTQQRTTGNDTENFQDNDPAVQGVPTQQLQPAATLTNIIRDLISNRPDAADIINDLVSSFDAVNVAEPGRDPGLLQTPTAAAFYDAMRLDNMGLDDFQRQQIAAVQLPLRERGGFRAAAPLIAAIGESDDEMLLGPGSTCTTHYTREHASRGRSSRVSRTSGHMGRRGGGGRGTRHARGRQCSPSPPHARVGQVRSLIR